MAERYDVVVPTVGRESLGRLLEALARASGPPPGRVIVVDDRPGGGPLPRGASSALSITTLRGRAAGPAAARNVGWRAASAPWVAFLDDDVVPEPDWPARLVEDLARAAPEVAGVQGRITVPLPARRRPTDWERNVAGLESARWPTADMAYRRSVLEEVGGFDERFPRAYREDADLALRVLAAGYRLEVGSRRVLHPVRPADGWVSLRLQAGNRDDVLMRALHGPGWRARAGAPRGRLRQHLATTAAGVLAVAALAGRRHRLSAALALAWAAATLELAWHRIGPGPRTRDEVVHMLATSALLPAVATGHALAGVLRRPSVLRSPGASARRASGRAGANGPSPAAVLLDRDGTIVVDVPYNGDPGRVVPVPGARRALDRLRSAGLALAVVSNQSAVGRGLISEDQLRAVNRRIEDVLGPLGHWVVCPHAPRDGCGCRKPAPGLVLDAARRLGVPPERCVVIGDTGADVDAARAVGARAILVPTAATRPEEVAAAPAVARTLEEAVDLVLAEVAR
ncbi:MAG TPA: HAD-IIIA family hydrolase [Actinomycetota bacterium]|nr:HAD-IIIA family hydrolase [Actinomycetota bacterium]